MQTEIGIVILAAGGSARFRSPKQLLKFEGKTLLRRAIDVAMSQDGCKVVVVLGQDHRKCIDEIKDLPMEIVANSGWQTGISSSIKLGLRTLLAQESGLSAVVFMLCDQPFVDRTTISRLIQAYRSTRKPIAACSYQDTLGVPALFAREMFAELMDLEGDIGAKPLILHHIAHAVRIDAPEAFRDIDEPEDYEKLLTQKQQ